MFKTNLVSDALLFRTGTALFGVVSLALLLIGLCALVLVVSLALLFINSGALFLLEKRKVLQKMIISETRWFIYDRIINH